MFERFTGDARAAVAQAQEHARRLGHPLHRLRASPARRRLHRAAAVAALREHGVTPEAVKTEIVRLVGLGRLRPACSARLTGRRWPPPGSIWTPCAHGSRPPSAARLDPGRPGRLPGKPARLAEQADDPAAAPPAAPAPLLGRTPAPARTPPGTSHSPRVPKELQRSVREALQLGQSYIGVEHALLAMGQGAVPPILSALGASPVPTCGPPSSTVTGGPADTAQEPPRPRWRNACRQAPLIHCSLARGHGRDRRCGPRAASGTRFALAVRPGRIRAPGECLEVAGGKARADPASRRVGGPGVAFQSRPVFHLARSG